MNRIIKFLKLRGYNSNQIAVKMGIARQVVHYWEKHDCQFLRADLVKKAQKAFNLSDAEVLSLF